MMDFTPLIQNLAEESSEKIPVLPEDYIGEDGLLRCGRCHTPKQARIVVAGRVFEPMGLCRCEAEKVEAEHERERRERRRDELLDRCFVYRFMREWRFEADNGSNPKLRGVCESFVENFDEFAESGRGLLLFGDVGRGKTWAAACIANALIDRGIACKFLDFTQIANTLTGTWEGRNDYIRTLAEYPLLILDDLNAERDTAYMDEVVYSVIDARCKANKPLVVTTNLGKEELGNPAKTNKKRIVSRLYEMCIPFEVIGNDQRKSDLASEYGHFKRMLGI